MATENLVSRARYYDALLAALDREVRVELTSERAKFLYAAARRILARLSTVNVHTPALAENLSADHPESPNSTPVDGDVVALHRALLQEGRLLDAIEEGVQQRLSGPAPTAAAAAPPAPVTDAAIEAYIQAHVDPTLRLVKSRILAGGRSKQTIMLTLANARHEEIERVVRRDLVIAITGATVVDEFRVLEALSDRDYPVPRPFLLEADSGALGSAFMLMQKVNGAVAGDIFEPPASRASVLQSARVLGRLHGMPVGEIAATLRTSLRSAPGAAQLREEIHDLERIWHTHSRAPCITMDAVFDWLLGNLDSVSRLSSVVHGDYSYHNLLFDGTDLSAVMDWELVRIGHPAEDVGYIRAAATQRVEWPEFMAAYRAGGGPELSQIDVTFYCLIGKLRLMRLLFGARQYFESGATDDLQLADVSIYHLPRLIQQASYEIRAALGLTA
jgi:aminoglycoside phosphotransferase (APT) family kinase protein